MLTKRKGDVGEGGCDSRPKYQRVGPGLAQSSVVNNTQARNGRIKVYVRIRPFKNSENSDNEVVQVLADEETSTTLVFDPNVSADAFYFKGEVQRMRDINKKVKKNQSFEFDQVFPQGSKNQQVFDATARSIISSVLDGFNCSVFAYGATGAGKTYTMLGKEDSPGISYLTIKELLHLIDEKKDKLNVSISVSYLEVYNEEVRDLLSPTGKKLELREEAGGATFIAGLKLISITDTRQLYTLLESGNKMRTQHPTDSNAESSRSHAVFQVRVKLQEKCPGGQTKLAKLTMIDLAGSERGFATGYKGMQFKEGRAINQSLLALGNCINALADGQKYVPYRDSKLTRILKDSLGGNCQTIMIANISPSQVSYDETYNTLKYATRARSILTSANQNLVKSNLSVSQYRQMVNQMKTTISKTESELSEAETWKNEMDKIMSEKLKVFSEAMALESQKKITEWRLNEAELLQRLHPDGLSERLVSSMDKWRIRVEVLDNRIKEFDPRIQEIKMEVEKLVEKMNHTRQHVSKYAECIYTSVYRLWQKELDAALTQVKTQHTDTLLKLMTKSNETMSNFRDKILPLFNSYYELLKAYGHVTASMLADHQSVMKDLQGKKYVSWENDNNCNEEQESNSLGYYACLSEPSSVAQVASTEFKASVLRNVVPAGGGLARLRHTTAIKKTPLRTLQPSSRPITRSTPCLLSKTLSKSPKPKSMQQIITSLNKENITTSKAPIVKKLFSETKCSAKKKLGYKQTSLASLRSAV